MTAGAIVILCLTSLATIEAGYYYYPYRYSSSAAISPSFVNSAYSTLYSTRSSQPIYYIRPYSRSAQTPLRKFARSYKVTPPADTSASTIILNETAVPFTVSKSALTTAEIEKNGGTGEEGVGPAVEVIEPASRITRRVVTKDKTKNKGRRIKKFQKPSFEPEVVYSDVHPVYVKPPTDFKPVVYPNRQMDGVRVTDRLSNQIPLMPPSAPYPYVIPRGLSSWSLGGANAVSRGHYWESLASDEALNLQPAANTIIPSAYYVRGSNSLSGVRRKIISNHHPGALPSLLPWLMVPSTASLYSYETQYPAASTFSILPLLKSEISPSSLPEVPDTKDKEVNPGKGSEVVLEEDYRDAKVRNSSEGLRTKLPVGLTSWLFGGMRDLTGKHWKMPDLTVENVDVVPLDNSHTPDDSDERNSGIGKKRVNNNSNNDNQPDIMMTSDGEYERVVPVATEIPEREREEKDESLRESGVVFDDDPEFVNNNNRHNANSNNNNINLS